MISLEQEIKQYFTKNNISFDDHSSSLKLLDFGFGDRESKRYFSFDAKEKCEPYQIKNWRQAKIPEKHLFILDDLAARKILIFAPNSGLVVRDNIHKSYHLFTIVDLFLMPKLRVNRQINRQVQTLKGKWLIDLRHGLHCQSLPDVFQAIESYLDDRENIFTNTLKCYGEYYGEPINRDGTTRIPKYWDKDYDRTR
ncbi:hypothetical protein GF337_01940 [candidate division KSB1 bacterium]|nr:hypothetical protein [candidate division KSB1 bacterium]